jgi:hypothetical protein
MILKKLGFRDKNNRFRSIFNKSFIISTKYSIFIKPNKEVNADLKINVLLI